VLHVEQHCRFDPIAGQSRVPRDGVMTSTFAHTMDNDPVSIRAAGRPDLKRIVELLADDALGALREIVSNPVDEAYEFAFDEILSQPGNCVLVAERTGTVVGCLQLTIVPGLSRRGAKRALIEGVRVSSEHRNCGIGERLVENAVERARAASCSLVQLTTDATRTHAHRFYERLGFSATHVGYKRDIQHEPSRR
jgi:ribosomal protein S18 acetylase RimI-like enzyme